MMKNIILFIILFIAFDCEIKAQQSIDTLNYLKQFETNKVQYINKPFSYLLSHIDQIQPKTINSFISILKKDLAANSYFKFSNIDKQYGTYKTTTLVITWKNPISHSQAFALSKQNHFLFTNDEKTFYGDKIVWDIKVYRR